MNREDRLLKREVLKALESRQFQIYLQPKVSLKKRSVVGAEALIRWIHPVRGYISPDIFIPICEKNEEIILIDYYVLEQVCKYIKECQKKGENLIPVSVNISRVSLISKNFIEKCVGCVREYQVPFQMIQMEITETAWIENEQRLIDRVKQLSNSGFTVAIDDFGSGYSSLTLLQQLPIDTIKLDKNLFVTIPQLEKSKIIVESIIDMARRLEIEVVAEGIESCKQLSFLQQIGCDIIQGYIFSKPLPLNEYKEYQKKMIERY